MYEMKMYGGSGFSAFTLILYILLKYPIKYGILGWLFMVILMLIQMVFDYLCKGVKYVIKFFNTILNPGEFDLILFKLPNIFKIFMAFLDLFIGVIYLFIGCTHLVALGLVTLPFNLIFSL